MKKTLRSENGNFRFKKSEIGIQNSETRKGFQKVPFGFQNPHETITV